MQERLTTKTAELETAAAGAQDLLRQISESTGQAEKDRQRVATIVEGVTAKVPRRRRRWGLWMSGGTGASESPMRPRAITSTRCAWQTVQ